MKKRLPLLLAITCSMTLCAQTQYGWIQKSMYGGDARHRTVGVTIGNRGYMGTGHVNSITNIAYDDWWEYDPGSDTWAQKADFPGGDRYHGIGFTIGTAAYVGMGRDESGQNYKDLYRYDATTNTWTVRASLPGSNRRGAVGMTINGKGYVGTGSYLTDWWEYDATTDTWTAKAPFPGPGRLSAVGVAVNGKGYIGTGDIGGGSNDLYEYNPVTDTWLARANFPGLSRMEACGFELNGNLYLGTGDDFSSGTNYQDMWCFIPASNSWVQVTEFAGSARRYMCSFTIGNRAYAGLGTSGINYKDLWEFGSISGVEETQQHQVQLSVFPNPIQEAATIKWNEAVSNAELQIVDVQGKFVETTKGISGSIFNWNRGVLPAGNYMLQLKSEAGVIANAKLILQ